MTSGYLIAIVLGLLSFVILAILGVLGTIETVKYQNEIARWKQWEELSKKK
tara:strand:- start:179 stop:331 length:153 start_codon:yes stop_codon:yes gene_type:complete